MSNSSYSQRLKKIIILAVLIPTLVFYVVIASTIVFISQKELKLNFNHSTNQTFTSINALINKAENSAGFLTTNPEVVELLTKLSKKKYSDNSLIDTKNVGFYIYNSLLADKSAGNITINTLYPINEYYTDYLKEKKNFIGQYSDIESKTTPQWYFLDSKIFLVKAILSPNLYDVVGELQIEIKGEILFNEAGVFNSQYAYYLKDQKKQTVLSENPIKKRIQPILHKQLDNNWTIEIFQRSGTSSLQRIVIPIVIVSGIFFLLLFIIIRSIIHNFSKHYTDRFDYLYNQTNFLSSGTVPVPPALSGDDELSKLSHRFVDMQTEIRQLLEDIKVGEQDKAYLQIRLLQEKMDPHFLYNILSTINWIAIDAKQDKIVQIISDLTTFYRTALNEGRELIRFDQEIKNVQSYIQLIEILTDRKIHFEVSLSPELKGLFVPTFILQPVIENSIKYGIDELETDEATITLTVTKDKNAPFIIKITNESPFHNTNSQLDKSKFGFALNSVEQRMKHLFNQSSRVEIHFSKSTTTTKLIFGKIINIDFSK